MCVCVSARALVCVGVLCTCKSTWSPRMRSCFLDYETALLLGLLYFFFLPLFARSHALSTPVSTLFHYLTLTLNSFFHLSPFLFYSIHNVTQNQSRSIYTETCLNDKWFHPKFQFIWFGSTFVFQHISYAEYYMNVYSDLYVCKRANERTHKWMYECTIEWTSVSPFLYGVCISFFLSFVVFVLLLSIFFIIISITL